MKRLTKMSRVLPYNAKQWEIPLLLGGRKTVTRRIAKGVYPFSEYGDFTTMIRGEMTGPISMENIIKIKCKYQPGDILYVRETWGWEPCWDCCMDTEEHNCCDESAHKFFNHDKGEWGCYAYKASLGDNAYLSVDTWHPSIHMPKEAARIWLKVTDVRVERLQEMKTEDFLSEGILGAEYEIETKNRFMKAWNSTIKKPALDRYGWDANPWVWVIEFERCEKPESEE